MKGQWFIISAVIASGVFLTMSVLFRDYFLVDSSVVASVNEDFYFRNVKNQIDSLRYLDGGCSESAVYNQNYKELKYLAETKMASIGYFLFIDEISGCPNHKYGIILASEKMVISENIDPDVFFGS